MIRIMEKWGIGLEKRVSLFGILNSNDELLVCVKMNCGVNECNGKVIK